MLTETSKTALQALLFVARSQSEHPCSPATIAENLGASASYMAKINTLLVKADILKTFRGVHGGVKLSRPLEAVTLLEIVEACQGKVLGDYCAEHPRLDEVCAYHKAMSQLQSAIVETLESWTLADLVAKPGPTAAAISDCRMRCAGG